MRLAREWGMTLCGYVRGRHMHIYSAPERLGLTADAAAFAVSLVRAGTTVAQGSG